MTRALAFASVALLAATPAFAQMGGPPQKVTLAQGLQRAYDGVKRNLTEMAEKMPEGWRDKVMHAQLRVRDRMLMGADAPPDWFEKPQGFSVSLNLDDVDAAKRIFAALAEGGTVRMEFQQTFWARGFGMLVDRFGIPWMLNVHATGAA